MPHTRIPPVTVEQILATAEPDPEWAAILESSPIPRGADYELDVLKDLSAIFYPRTRTSLDASRPSNVAELEAYFEIPATELKPEPANNRAIIAYPQPSASEIDTKLSEGWPLVVLNHGGGHTVGNPESELPLARLLVQQYDVVVVLPAYRLAPEHPFPTSYSDSLEVLKQLAQECTASSESSVNSRPKVLPQDLISKIDLSRGFIVGGTSAGAAISASIYHLYQTWRKEQLSTLPPITGILFACGSLINPYNVPSNYAPYYHSRKQNAAALPLDADLYAIFQAAFKPDFNSPVWASIDQQPALNRNKLGEDHRYLQDQGTRVYVQVCGQDMARDDGLIYERMLREESGVDTRLDLYAGFGHVFWGMGGGYAEMEMSKKRMRDSVDGVGWLLRRDG